MKTTVLSKFSMLIGSLHEQANCELIYAYAVDSNYEVIAVLPSDMLSNFAHGAYVVNHADISDMEMHVEVLDASEHDFKVKVTCKSK